MPKKYLLYIHNPEFGNEPKKSALVNDLLGQYYSRHKLPPPLSIDGSVTPDRPKLIPMKKQATFNRSTSTK